MKQVVVSRFGGPEVLRLEEVPTPEAGEGQVRVRLTSIGLNHAELMGRRGEYKLSTGDPPFVPGLEGGGVIDAVGKGVDPKRVGQRVVLSPDAPRSSAGGGYGGTYRTHYVVPADRALPAPDAVPDDQLGALWLSYFTACGALLWKHGLKPGQIVALPAASSSVALAAAQVVKKHGGITIGLTSTPAKVEQLRALPTAMFDHLVVTHDAGRKMRPWHRDLRAITAEHPQQGVDVFFDPVASGEYLNAEIRSLAKHGTIIVYGLLGEPGVVDVTPLIRKQASIVGWVNNELIEAGEEAWRPVCEQVLAGFADGSYRQHIGGVFRLDDVQRAHAEMEQGRHIGKLVMVP